MAAYWMGDFSNIIYDEVNIQNVQSTRTTHIKKSKQTDLKMGRGPE